DDDGREGVLLAASDEVQVEQLPVERFERAEQMESPDKDGDGEAHAERDDSTAPRERPAPRQEGAQRRPTAQVRAGLQWDTAIPTGLMPTGTLLITRCVPVSMTASWSVPCRLTYTRPPSGLALTPLGLLPTEMRSTIFSSPGRASITTTSLASSTAT